MKNHTKLSLIIAGIFLLAFGLGKAFHLSFNPDTFQIGYTVYSEKGQEFLGFIPEKKNIPSSASCTQKCDESPSAFALQCRQEGHQVYSGPCCESLCSASLVSFNQGQTL